MFLETELEIESTAVLLRLCQDPAALREDEDLQAECGCGLEQTKHRVQRLVESERLMECTTSPGSVGRSSTRGTQQLTRIATTLGFWTQVFGRFAWRAWRKRA